MTGLRRCGKRWKTRDDALRSKKGLTGHYLPYECACEGWHLNELVLKPVPSWSAKPAKDTGPSRGIRALVLARDGYQCARCGRPAGPGIGPYSLQHRLARGSGGTSDPDANSPVRLVLLCGSATTLCHGEVESRRFPEDQAKGYRLERGQDPAAEAVMYFGQDGGFTAWLLPDGGLSFDGPEAVTA